MTCYTAIFGDYDYLKPIKVPQKSDINFVLFTDQPNDSDIFDLVRDDNPWEVRRVDVLPGGEQKTARYYKIMSHEVIDDDVSLWIDGTFFVNCDIENWMRKRFKSPMTVVAHPFDSCIYTDIISCIKSGRGDPEMLIEQRNFYKSEGLPINNGLISSGILMRNRDSRVKELCETWWNQVDTWSGRDQVAFGYAAWKHPGVFNVTRWNYTQQKEFEHCPHRHKDWAASRAFKMAGLK